MPFFINFSVSLLLLLFGILIHLTSGAPPHPSPPQPPPLNRQKNKTKPKKNTDGGIGVTGGPH